MGVLQSRECLERKPAWVVGQTADTRVSQGRRNIWNPFGNLVIFERKDCFSNDHFSWTHSKTSFLEISEIIVPNNWWHIVEAGFLVWVKHNIHK